tara:strand:- start:43351 stop:44256 length:906 start_codon:yes stop_codon:yes gene_type:complete
MKVLCTGLAVFSLIYGAVALGSDDVVRDGDVGLSKEELEQSVKYWTPDMQKAAANNVGDRLELLNAALTAKKIAREADQVDPQSNPEAYWKYVLSMRNLQRKFVMDNYMASLDVPDMVPLGKERYITEKDKYAFVPEIRLSSHILLMCNVTNACDNAATEEKAKDIVAQLRGGADFEELVAQYSEDPGSKDKGGKFDRWLKLGEANVSPHYTGGVFEIENVGDYSDPVRTKFGFHIIRLDDRVKEHYRTYEEVKDQIEASLRKEYLELASKEFVAKYRISDDGYIDHQAMEEIFGPYKTEQ